MERQDSRTGYAGSDMAGSQGTLPEPGMPGGSAGSGSGSWQDTSGLSGTTGEGQTGDSLKDKAGQIQEKAGEMGGQAQEKADVGLQKTADGLDRAAGALREKLDGQGGTAGSAATSAVDALEQGAEFLRNTNSEQILDDLESFVRQRPVESMVIAAGLGFVFSKALR